MSWRWRMGCKCSHWEQYSEWKHFSRSLEFPVLLHISVAFLLHISLYPSPSYRICSKVGGRVMGVTEGWLRSDGGSVKQVTRAFTAAWLGRLPTLPCMLWGTVVLFSFLFCKEVYAWINFFYVFFPMFYIFLLPGQTPKRDAYHRLVLCNFCGVICHVLFFFLNYFCGMRPPSK